VAANALVLYQLQQTLYNQSVVKGCGIDIQCKREKLVSLTHKFVYIFYHIHQDANGN